MTSVNIIYIAIYRALECLEQEQENEQGQDNEHEQENENEQENEEQGENINEEYEPEEQ